MKVTIWFLIETKEEYQKAVSRYEELKNASKGSDEHKEKMLIVHLISEYETKTSELPEVDPIEMIKIRMEDFWIPYYSLNHDRKPVTEQNLLTKRK